MLAKPCPRRFDGEATRTRHPVDDRRRVRRIPVTIRRGRAKASMMAATVVTAEKPIQHAYFVFSFQMSVSGPRLRTVTGIW